MFSLIISFFILIVGYMAFSRVTSTVFAPDSRKTPAIAINDGVDCVPMAKPRLFLVQLLNIAGTGPIFGPIMGAVFGPVVFLWIIFGTILGGAVHDFMVGMVSSRNGGASIAELSGTYIGKGVKYFMRGFSVVLLILCGAVFLTTPAQLLAYLTPEALDKTFWIIMIIIYYFLATILPIDKIIGKLYPVFGILLLTMAFSMLGGLFVQGYANNIPEFWEVLVRDHPNGLPMWPCMFVTVACGAISGFHATQSPMAAKCIENESQGRQVFYGAMVGETVIALIWAAVGVACYGTAQELQDVISQGGAGQVVLDTSKLLLGQFGSILAIIGVIVCPITSGDTAFRSARLIVAEATHLDQKKVWNRLILTVPVVGAGVGLALGLGDNFDILWRYFAAANQTLAMIALWVGTFYLLKKSYYKGADFLTVIPAAFMVAVSMTYIIVAKECFNAPIEIGYPIGGALALLSFIAYLIYRFIYLNKHKAKRPFAYKYLRNEKKKSAKLLKEFKVELLLNKYYVLQKRDIDVMLLKILQAYHDDYEMLQKFRIGSRVEEILNLREKLREHSLPAKTKKDKFFNFFIRIDTYCKIKTKRFTAKFMKRKPMNVGTYYHYFKYRLMDALKHGVIYSNQRGNLNEVIVVYPNNFQRINESTFANLPLKGLYLITGKSGEVVRAQAFDDFSRHHLEANLKNHYWYIYEMAPSSDQKANNHLLKILNDFADKHKLDIYVDDIYNYGPIYKRNGFKEVENETVDYAQIPHSLYLRTPKRR
ncbi:MAG: carbon starvation protein A [Bacilli bacterium]|nr:carbon starvation protein A [Bacilli bacterium]